MVKKNITQVTKEVISFLKKNSLFIEMTSFANPEDYVTHNNINTISIDSFGISLFEKYNNGNFDEDEIDENGNPIKSIDDLKKDLVEFIKSYVEDSKHVIILIETSIDLPKEE